MIELLLDDDHYDTILELSRDNATPQVGERIALAVKKKATVSGKGGVAITWNVMYKDEPLIVQATVTVAELLAAGRAIAAYCEVSDE